MFAWMDDSLIIVILLPKKLPNDSVLSVAVYIHSSAINYDVIVCATLGQSSQELSQRIVNSQIWLISGIASRTNVTYTNYDWDKSVRFRKSSLRLRTSQSRLCWVTESKRILLYPCNGISYKKPIRPLQSTIFEEGRDCDHDSCTNALCNRNLFFSERQKETCTI
jgi:hypothetical protein